MAITDGEKTDPAEAGARDPAEAGPRASLWLTIFGDAGVVTESLPASGRIVLGRAPDAGIVISDASLSRNHAALTLRADGCDLEDLGSRNGTRVGERRLAPGERAALRAGDTFALGNTTVIVHAAAVSERPRRVLSHAQLEIYLEAECSRAAEGDAPFALARVQLAHAPEIDAGETAAPDAAPSVLERLFSTGLRPRDLLATYAPGVYQVLFLGTKRGVAASLVADLERQAAQLGLQVRTALASFPADGRSPEELVDAVGRMLAAEPDGTGEEHVRSSPDAITALMRRVAASPINVILFGETGSGKEVMARTLHDLSPRRDKPLVSLNCAALTEALLESELFGYEKGAFTGAVQAKAGLLESADGGTVFLDEIGEMPPAIQAKLLRVIELKQVQRLGALRPRLIDVRFLAATHRDLDAEVRAGRFRQDLLFRLNGISVVVAPLRERVEEIEPLAELFLARFATRMGAPRPPQLSPEARRALRAYAWPGNVRELRNVMERAVVLAGDGVITPRHLPLEKMTAKTLPGPPRIPSVTGLRTLATPGPAPGPERPTAPDEGDERARILDALERTGGNQTDAAALLGMSRRTLINRLERYNLPRPRKR